jgi:hypothetical protein
VVATWLNYLANGGTGGVCIDNPGTEDDAFSPQHYLDDAIDWFQQFASDANSVNPNDNLNNDYHSGVNQATFEFDFAQKTNWSAWQAPFQDIDHSAAEMHSALDGYNNTGIINNVEFCCDADNPAALYALSQIA